MNLETERGGRIGGVWGEFGREFRRDVRGVWEEVVRRSLGGNIGGDWESLGRSLGGRLVESLGEMLGEFGR